jgi:hypothetical protein
MDYFGQQLALKRSAPKPEKGYAHNDFTLDTIGVTNGCIDMIHQGPLYPQFAYNNTYGFEAIPKVVYEEASANFTKPGGCRDLILRCRELGKIGDPGFVGNNETVNEACVDATKYCSAYVLGAYDALSNVWSPFLLPPVAKLAHNVVFPALRFRHGSHSPRSLREE